MRSSRSARHTRSVAAMLSRTRRQAQPIQIHTLTEHTRQHRISSAQSEVIDHQKTGRDSEGLCITAQQPAPVPTAWGLLHPPQRLARRGYAAWAAVCWLALSGCCSRSTVRRTTCRLVNHLSGSGRYLNRHHKLSAEGYERPGVLCLHQ